MSKPRFCNPHRRACNLLSSFCHLHRQPRPIAPPRASASLLAVTVSASLYISRLTNRLAAIPVGVESVAGSAAAL
ncbi:hypothetical protein BBK36DRAFT_1164154 [Trichoderma citrinoviride]|uniref:Uncharacterized protein n=1 Tax=Trichoderma citrinoviride TaxID=58853 RepID=A0A2T4AWC9_9HYPO|nr:hypothetical protein BBK36DRAFT_1164154 [Trichoderma citrinoviride]PTB61339.1 hypothetical protein BBK36DRAFT_1164154 [Trichoderma citrinoviride]